MKTKKLNLNQLQVESFVTSLNNSEIKTVYSGERDVEELKKLMEAAMQYQYEHGLFNSGSGIFGNCPPRKPKDSFSPEEEMKKIELEEIDRNLGRPHRSLV